MGEGILAIDLGNAALKCAAVVGGALSPVTVVPAGDPGFLRQVPGSPPGLALASSSNPREWPGVEAALVRAGLRVLLVGRDVPVPIGIRYDTPSTLGTDRLLSALAASSMARGRAFVLSAGTAITGDWVDEEGVFRGGAIAPGLGALVGALAASLPHLPRPRVPLSVSYPGVSSQESVDAGCRAAFLGTVRALHRAAEQAAGGPLPAVVTGGDAVTAAAALEDTVVLVVPHLPLLGLARMARDLLARNAWMRAPGV